MSFSGEPKTDQRLDQWTQVRVAGVNYQRLPLRTRWLDETDDLVLSLKESLELARPGDTVGVSETVTILLTGRTVDISTVQPGWLARFLARYVHPRGEHARGLSVPEKMQYVIRTVGLRRIIAATIGSAADSAVGRARNVLSNRWTDRPRRRRRASHAVRARPSPTAGHQGRSGHLCRPRASTRHRRQHCRPQ